MLDTSLQVEHLLLLVGRNPLPDAVAAQLLVPRTGVVSLIHSPATAEFALNLASWLIRRGHKVVMREIHESNPASIFAGVKERLGDVRTARVGLNYTGGTKTMAVHAYRAAERWAAAQHAALSCSYLDARALALVFDPLDPASGAEPDRRYVGRAFDLGFEELLELHGLKAPKRLHKEPFLPAAARALAQANADHAGLAAWLAWKRGALDSYHKKNNPDEWDRKRLAEDALSMPTDPALQPFVQTLIAELGLPDGTREVNLAVVSRQAGQDDPAYFADWLAGKWLEHHLLDLFWALAPESHLHHCAQGVVVDFAKVNSTLIDFEMDAIAMRGYQLFVASCSVDANKRRLKLKLFEAFVRARQLGGDEARVALVCRSPVPDEIEAEMKRDVDPEGRIRVFGLPHWAELREHLRTWIAAQSKEE